jgi:hypothetical protein
LASNSKMKPNNVLSVLKNLLIGKNFTLRKFCAVLKIIVFK